MTMGLSWVSFGLEPNVYFCIAFVIVVIALYLYHRPEIKGSVGVQARSLQEAI